MAKTTGLGDNYYLGGYDLSGDTNSLSKISGGPAPIDTTAINQSGYERLGGLRDGGIDFVSYFNPTGAHVALSPLPTADVICSYFRGTAIGNPAACYVAKQVNYDPTRGQDGSLTFAVATQANGFGLEWGEQLTAGLRTDTVATNGASQNDLAATAFGAQAYLQVTGFAGTSVTVTIQDSADNVTFANVTGLSFTAVTAAPASQRLATSNTATIRQYVRAVTTGTFTSATFAVMLARNSVAGVVF